jgi:hypothetical protein
MGLVDLHIFRRGCRQADDLTACLLIEVRGPLRGISFADEGFCPWLTL